nr:unnamed protein product [Callosobruchus chinensis]
MCIWHPCFKVEMPQDRVTS